MPGAPVFWSPDIDTGVVVLVPVPAFLTGSGEPCQRLEAVSVRIDDQGSHAFYDFCDGQRLQLLRIGAEPLAALVPLGLDGFDRLEAVHRLLAAIHGRTPPPDTRLTRQQRARLRRMLQVIDGHRSGASQREIARIVLRTDRLGRDEWQTSSARYTVMSLLRDAHGIIAGGYRKLLRHRRRS